MRSLDLKSFFLGALALVIVGIVVAALLILTGAYNVAASAGHTPLTRAILSTTMKQSVKAHAGDTAPHFDAAMIRAGGGEYKGMCAQCHGGPGQKRSEWAEGMTPMPPDLTKEAAEWSPAQIHWIIKHGVKMSAMPAFGGTHDDQKIWSIAAFVKQLPSMSAAAYAAVPMEKEEGHEGGGEAGEE